MLMVRSSFAATALAVTLIVLLVVSIVVLVVTPWQQSIAGRGRVIALSPAERHQRLESPVDGRIERVLVKEGQRVEEDEIIVELADVDPLFLERLASEAALIALRAQAATDRRQSIEDRIASLTRARETGLSAADARIAMAVERVHQSEQAVIAADAERDAQKLRGEGDAEAARIYAEAANRDPSFYAFQRSLEAYRKSFAGGDSVIVLDRDDPFLQYLKSDR